METQRERERDRDRVKAEMLAEGAGQIYVTSREGTSQLDMEETRTVFSLHGAITSIQPVALPLGGFVLHYSTRRDAEGAARAMDGRSLHNFTLRVEFQKPTEIKVRSPFCPPP